MSLAPGVLIGTYEVIAPLGAGGMGEVYRARDTRLPREVAIKVLPEVMALDASRRARFQREARVLASLNHPNIATLYGVEDSPSGQVLVMELVDGDTLAARLMLAGPGAGLPITEALTIARQVAAALEAAHDSGIIHRDLKPQNIMVRPDGTAKVLDFGLAIPTDAAATAGDTHAETASMVTLPAVGTGPGTPAYMSPEQARGLPVDKRTDIWSYGCVLYEVLTGQRPFAGARPSDLLARILERDPDFDALPPNTPPAIRRLLRRCLTKDPRARLRDIGDARQEVEEALTGTPSDEAQGPAAGGTGVSARWRWAAGVLGAATLALLATTVYLIRSAAVEELLWVHHHPPQSGMFLTPLGTGSSVPVGGTLSPDGSSLAFTAADASGRIALWVRRLDRNEEWALPGTDAAALPFWSPDSSALGFFGIGKLKRINVSDNAMQVLADVERGRGGSWNRDGVIVFARTLAGELRRVNDDGTDERSVTARAGGQRSHSFPSFLPDGRRFLYYVEDDEPDESGIFTGELDTEASRRVRAADSGGVYALTGHLLFVLQRTLYAQAFDLATLQVSGSLVSLATSVPAEGASPAFSVSETGRLTFGGLAEDQQFAWFDRRGNLVETVGLPGNYRGMDLSPDGTRTAVHRHDEAGGDILVFEERGATIRVTHNARHDNSSPIFSPDGRRIVFASFRNGRWGLYRKRADGSEADELLRASTFPVMPLAWASDDRSIVYSIFERGIHSWLLELGAAVEPRKLFDMNTSETHGQVSPNGKWIAYQAFAAPASQIYVRGYPAGEEIWPVSTSGGVTPRWGWNSELFYVTSFDNGTLMAVPFREKGETFVPGVPEELFRAGMVTPPHTTTVNTYHTYGVSPDGQRFLIPRPVSTLRGNVAPRPITLIENWRLILER